MYGQLGRSSADVQVPSPDQALSHAQALTAFLALEGFLLAVVSLTVTLGAAAQPRQRAMPVKPMTLARCATGLAAVVGFGGLTAWWSTYTGGELRPVPDVIIAVVVLVTLLAQPIFAFLLSFGLRFRS